MSTLYNYLIKNIENRFRKNNIYFDSLIICGKKRGEKHVQVNYNDYGSFLVYPLYEDDIPAGFLVNLKQKDKDPQTIKVDSFNKLCQLILIQIIEQYRYHIKNDNINNVFILKKKPKRHYIDKTFGNIIYDYLSSNPPKNISELNSLIIHFNKKQQLEIINTLSQKEWARFCILKQQDLLKIFEVNNLNSLINKLQLGILE